ncbi:MAG: hopanoid biosynthesis-associated RND transporter HpnN [Nevskiaceae bacterium]|nr:MAG: hopanoid biosynthesis-associated RND transporter HpnN [Nevskiaceae bacterium]TBR73562.1 MAG: hopanoid biosynthesis-associated RND transporter HpnN [Nevskiaceae bacterium]
MVTAWVRAWVELMQRRAWWVVAVAVLCGAGMVVFISGHLSIDTDTSAMIAKDLPWKAQLDRVDRLFPQQNNTLAIVIDGDTPATAARAQRELVDRLRKNPQLFTDVFALDTEPFFRDNGLLFVDLPELKDLSARLLQAQPFLGTLAQDPSLAALFTLLDRAITHGGDADFDLAPALTQMADGVAAATDARHFDFSWQALMGGVGVEEANSTRKFIEVKPQLDYSQMLAGRPAIDAVRAAARDLQLDAAHGVRVRLTGTVALEYEELLSSMSGAGIAFGIGLIFVILLLFVALRSWRLVIAAVVTLIYGLLVTTFFAATAVGHLNLISIAFGVLYIGLGIDYALYLCMRYRECVGQEEGNFKALSAAARDVGGFMGVCALTTSIGFFAFTPTAYTGVAELGLISGVGMFISLVLSLSLLPAVIALLPPDPATVKLQVSDRGVVATLLAIPYTHARALWIGAAVLAVGCIALLPRVHFDYNPLDLRDPHSESVSTARELMRDPDIPSLAMDVLEPDAAAAHVVAAKLDKLPLVRRTMSIESFIPDDQDAKLAVIGDLAFMVGPSLESSTGGAIVADDARDLAALRKLAGVLTVTSGQDAQGVAERALGARLAGFDTAYGRLDAAGRKAILARLRGDLLGSWPQQLADLQDLLKAQPVTLASLPPDLVRRWVAPDGTYRVNIWPRQVLDSNGPIEAFATQVRAAVPAATGAPVEYVESGRAVVQAFQHAFLFAFIAILVLLVVLLRNVVDTLLVLLPLVLAGLYTVGETVLLGIPFNFANVIALPLILGVGVDYGVYIVQSARGTAGRDLLKTGAARAVLFGALITVANFGNLGLSHHPGTRSLGLVLTLGLTSTLLCALVLLPSLLAWRYKRLKSLNPR